MTDTLQESDHNNATLYLTTPEILARMPDTPSPRDRDPHTHKTSCTSVQETCHDSLTRHDRTGKAPAFAVRPHTSLQEPACFARMNTTHATSSHDLTPPKSLTRLAGRAIADFNMIREGDRILLGLSGGKDSLSLLMLLRHFQRRAPIRFDLGAVTVDPQSPDFDPSSLIPYLAGLDIPYHYEREPILEMAESHMQNDSFCAFCARMKRGVMYSAARREGYNVIALAQHLDDLAESFLMSAFHGGQLRTMKAHYLIDAGDLRVIRPLVYARERQTRDYALSAGLPVIPENCPACFAMPTQREHMKSLLATQEAEQPRLFRNLLSTLKPLMSSGQHHPD